jgi:hypothetical protein
VIVTVSVAAERSARNLNIINCPGSGGHVTIGDDQ